MDYTQLITAAVAGITAIGIGFQTFNSKRFKDQDKTNEFLREQLEVVRVQNTSLNQRIASLETDNMVLRSRVSHLEEENEVLLIENKKLKKPRHGLTAACGIILCTSFDMNVVCRICME